MRERLMQLLGEAIEPYLDRVYPWDTFDDIADHLLENGVIVPPCKIGDTIYVIETTLRKGNKLRSHIATREVTGICSNKLNLTWVAAAEKTYEHRYHPTELGETVFLTREAAEEALKARENK